MERQTFYHRPTIQRGDLFCGRIPGIRVPNFTLGTIEAFYSTLPTYRYVLVLSNNIHLSIYKGLRSSCIEIMQLDPHSLRATSKPCFSSHRDCDEFGVITIYESDLKELIEFLAPASSYVHGV